VWPDLAQCVPESQWDAIEAVAEVGLGPADGESVGAGTDLDGPVSADSAGDPLAVTRPRRTPAAGAQQPGRSGSPHA
jgi:hypothetical protein